LKKKANIKTTGRLYGLPFSFVFFGVLFVGRGFSLPFSFRGVAGRFWVLFWGILSRLAHLQRLLHCQYQF
jgi:hypothetical protein